VNNLATRPPGGQETRKRHELLAALNYKSHWTPKWHVRAVLRLGNVQKVPQFGEGVLDDGVVGPFAALLPNQQAGVHQFFQVMANGGLADAEYVDEITRADRMATLGRHVGQDT